jgi:hypothetical protein
MTVENLSLLLTLFQSVLMTLENRKYQRSTLFQYYHNNSRRGRPSNVLRCHVVRRILLWRCQVRRILLLCKVKRDHHHFLRRGLLLHIRLHHPHHPLLPRKDDLVSMPYQAPVSGSRQGLPILPWGTMDIKDLLRRLHLTSASGYKMVWRIRPAQEKRKGHNHELHERH